MGYGPQGRKGLDTKSWLWEATEHHTQLLLLYTDDSLLPTRIEHSWPLFSLGHSARHIPNDGCVVNVDAAEKVTCGGFPAE